MERNIGECVWNGLQDFYGISACDRVWRGTNHQVPDRDKEFTENIKKGDIVTVELNCKSSELIFKKGDKKLYGPMKLPQRKAWYPAFHLGFSSTKSSVKIVHHDSSI